MVGVPAAAEKVWFLCILLNQQYQNQCLKHTSPKNLSYGLTLSWSSLISKLVEWIFNLVLVV